MGFAPWYAIADDPYEGVLQGVSIQTGPMGGGTRHGQHVTTGVKGKYIPLSCDTGGGFVVHRGMSTASTSPYASMTVGASPPTSCSSPQTPLPVPLQVGDPSYRWGDPSGGTWIVYGGLGHDQVTVVDLDTFVLRPVGSS